MRQGQGRWRRLADLLRDAAQGVEVGPAVAGVAAELLGVVHVSLTFVVGESPVEAVGNSETAVALCLRQFTLGEGPSVVAMRTGSPVLVPDLAAEAPRMPMLAADPVAQDVGAIFAFPLRVGGALVGTMTGSRAAPGPLTEEQYTDGLIVATLATIALLQREAGATLGRIVVDFEPLDDPTAALHDIVQIAAGMVSELLGVTIVEALVRMRAHAFASDATLLGIARRIVAGELRLPR